MIELKDVFNFFSNKPNFENFLRMNTNFDVSYNELFKGYLNRALSKAELHDWLAKMEEKVNLNVLVDYYEKFKGSRK